MATAEESHGRIRATDLHVLGRNMAYLLKAMELAKRPIFAQPKKEPAAFMNFIHGEEA